MSWAGNLHGHCYYCDGKEKPEEYVLKALELGHRYIGFSSHIPLARHRSHWNMAPENFYKYLNEVQYLKRDFAGSILILCAFEMDDPYSLYTCQDLRELYSDLVDYTVGSVHYLDVLPDGSLWEVDGATETFMKGVEDLCNGSMEMTLSRYFDRLLEMLNASRPTIAGHVDKVIIHEPVKAFVRENPGFYEQKILAVFRAIKNLGITLEINTRGLYTGRNNDVYPARRFWPYLKEFQIPVVITSDCHQPEELAEGCKKIRQEALSAGLNVVDLPPQIHTELPAPMGCR